MERAASAGYTPLRDYRYERKFLVEDLTFHQILGLVRLHPRMFYAPYPPRYVNNAYLDTADLENYYDNVCGAARRRKVRLRWYGALAGPVDHAVLEFKVKEGHVGRKHSYPLRDFSLDDVFGDRRLQQVAAGSELPAMVREELRAMQVVLLNRYYRHYFASRDGRFRVTLDREIAFYRANGAFGSSLVHRQVRWGVLVVELKYDVAQETAAARVSSAFPFRVTRSSKYVQGMERVYF
ncbi:MAG: polyphosphate polymerase domain-containing protein [Chloroflexia bacterium]|nr:polyphosphate polymerase domain-containing protein [Chloroflexia bacterium]